jgi:hypothetical protein
MTPHPAHPSRVRRIPAAATRRLVAKALAASSGPPTLDISAFEKAPAGLLRSLPSWVGSSGLLRGGDEFVLWCTPRRNPKERRAGQFVLDLPSGRYFVEVFDPNVAAWVSRESAEGGPLVAGLPFAEGPVLARVRAAGRPDDLGGG